MVTEPINSAKDLRVYQNAYALAMEIGRNERTLSVHGTFPRGARERGKRTVGMDVNGGVGGRAG